MLSEQLEKHLEGNIVQYVSIKSAKICNPYEFAAELSRVDKLSPTQGFYLGYLLSKADVTFRYGHVNGTKMLIGVHLATPKGILALIKECPENTTAFANWFLKRYYDIDFEIGEAYIEVCYDHKPWDIPSSMWIVSSKGNSCMIFDFGVVGDSIRCVPK